MQTIRSRTGNSDTIRSVARSRVLAAAAVGLLFATTLVSVVVGVGAKPAWAYGPSYCSGYRWDVKTGQDSQAGQVKLSPVVPTDVATLTGLTAPSNPSSRVSPTEFTVYQITATIVDAYPEHDGDIHVVIQDNSSSNVMITEIPDPLCVPSSSPFAAMAANARNVFDSTSSPIGKNVTIDGVGFFDSNTLTSGVAPNKIELHPVLNINFGGGPPPTDFFTVTAPASASVMQGQSVPVPITTQVTSGSPQSVTLSASGLPSGATASFSPNPINSGGGSTMTVTASPSTATGTYPVTVKGTGTSTTYTTTMSLTVAAGNDFSLSANPNSLTVAQGLSGTTTISSAVVRGSAQMVSLTAGGLPAGATASFSPSTITVGGSSTMTIKTALGTPVGDDYPVSVTATGPFATHVALVSLGVDPATATRGGKSARGYWEAATDGGIFTFGVAGFYGSEGGRPLNRPIVGMTQTPDAGGYWLVASDGGIFTFGDAGFFGSTGGTRLNAPVTAMAIA